jgi:hypothetical protein
MATQGRRQYGQSPLMGCLSLPFMVVASLFAIIGEGFKKLFGLIHIEFHPIENIKHALEEHKPKDRNLWSWTKFVFWVLWKVASWPFVTLFTIIVAVVLWLVGNFWPILRCAFALAAALAALAILFERNEFGEPFLHESWGHFSMFILPLPIWGVVVNIVLFGLYVFYYRAALKRGKAIILTCNMVIAFFIVWFGFLAWRSELFATSSWYIFYAATIAQILWAIQGIFRKPPSKDAHDGHGGGH